MKYLKIFESFLTEYKTGMSELYANFEKNKKEHTDKYKSIIDEYLYDLTDYNLISDISVMDKKGSLIRFEVMYELEIPFENIEIFIKDLKTADIRLSEDLQLGLYLSDMEFIDSNSKGISVNHGQQSHISDLTNWMNHYNISPDYGNLGITKKKIIKLNLIIIVK